MKKNGRLFLLLSFAFVGLMAGCSGDGNKPATAEKIPTPAKATRENYLSGREFCRVYSEITNKEIGKFVTVPRDYADLSKGTIEIYTFLPRAFDTSKSTFVYVDGGPGQNSHGRRARLPSSRLNEIRFDQRGLGCSAPATYDDYVDASLYSTENNVRDMDEIRKAYGLQKWSIHGLSYGSVPATMYASLYPEHVTSSVLEGVLGTSSIIHDNDFKVSKLNLLLSKLSYDERSGFDSLIERDSANGYIFVSFVMGQFYQDRGMGDVLDIVRSVVSTDGRVKEDVYQSLVKWLKDDSPQTRYSQTPGGVDETVFEIISCKNLGYANRPGDYVNYSYARGFYIARDTSTNNFKLCKDIGVSFEEQQTYEAANYPTSVPTYYFQGAHDGATNATGALKHFKSVPQGQTYFLLAERGGHNPNMTRMYEKNGSIAAEEGQLFYKALMAEPILQTDLYLINSLKPNERWVLYTDPTLTDTMSVYFEGLKIAR